MRVLLVTAGEPLPFDRADIRLHRTGQFAAWLAAHGHEVDWVTNRFDHFRKVQRDGPDVVAVSPSYRIHLLNSRGYRRNISVARFLDHADLGRDFRERAAQFGPSDVVLAAMPTIELAAEAVAWANARRVASFVDIRDLWPDLFVERVPHGMRWTARVALRNLERTLRLAMHGADGIIALNQQYLDWGIARARRAAGSHDAVIPLGYELRDLAAADRASAVEFWRQKGLSLGPGGPPVMAFAGSVSSQFDFGPVLAAGAMLRARGVRTVVCGIGEQLPSLTRAAGDHPEILLAGWCSYAQLRVLLEHATVGLLPYRDSLNFRNAVPNKAGEYLAHGLPLAWSLGSGPLAALIARHGVGVSYERNGEALATAVAGFLDEPARLATARTAATGLFRDEFDTERVHVRLLDHLQRGVAARRAAAT
jgi:glycosyltransferase involved in cell wall biosynthesis